MRLCLCTFLLLLLSLPLLAAEDRAKSSPADVFLITIDTLRVDHVHCFAPDAVPSPNIDRLCSDGVRFTQAVTASPLTNSSHATIMTGRYPSAHGVTTFGAPLRSDIPTLAEQLHQHGYKTAAFIGSVVLDSHTLPGIQRGFDFYDDFDATLPASVHWGRVERRGTEVVAHALKWMRAHPTGPRFVWVHLYDPHDPYEPPAPFADRYSKTPYDGEIAYADSVLGTLLNALQAAGRYRPSLIVLAADHGEGLGEHDEETHGIFLYDSTLRVPLVIKLPAGAHAGTTVTEEVRTADIAPTLLDLLSFSPLPNADGRSLRAAVESKPLVPVVAFSETDYPLSFGWAPLRAVRTADSKFIDAPRPELYDLKSDEHEHNNLYEPWNATVQKLRSDLAEFREKYPAVTAGAAPVAQSTLDELGALGYLPKTRGETTVAEPSLLPDAKDKIRFQNLLHTAMLQREHQHLEEARATLRSALALDAGSAAALSQLGSIELKLGDTRSALEHLQRAVALDSKDAAAARDLAIALEKTGDRAGAAKALEAALAASPGDASLRRHLGNLYLSMGDLPKAADQFEAAIFLDPKNVDTRIALAKVLMQQKNESSARAQLEKAAQLDPTNKEVQQMLSQLPQK